MRKRVFKAVGRVLFWDDILIRFCGKNAKYRVFVLLFIIELCIYKCIYNIL